MTNLQPTPIVDKNGKQTTVHRKPFVATADRQLPMPVGVKWSARDENMANIDDTVIEFSKDGLFSEAVSLFGNRRYEVNLPFGRMEDGKDLWVKLRLDYVEAKDMGYINENMEPIENFWDATLTGQVKDAHGNTFQEGQIQEMLLDIKYGGETNAAAATLYEGWQEIHGNIARPGTKAQLEYAEDNGLDWRDNSQWDDFADSIPVDKGHMFGSRNIIYDIDAATLGRVLDVLNTSKQQRGI